MPDLHLDAFEASLADNAPPTGLTPALAGLWHAAPLANSAASASSANRARGAVVAATIMIRAISGSPWLPGGAPRPAPSVADDDRRRA